MLDAPVLHPFDQIEGAPWAVAGVVVTPAGDTYDVDLFIRRGLHPDTVPSIMVALSSRVQRLLAGGTEDAWTPRSDGGWQLLLRAADEIDPASFGL